jgi:periplasmic protein CpxP/Spy
MKKVLLGLVGSIGLFGLVALAADAGGQAGSVPAGKAKIGMRRGGLGLNLTADQKAKIAEIRKNAHEQIMNVLTDEQKAKLAAAKEKVQAMRPNLTDEQKTQIKAIFQAAREKAKAAQTPQEKVKIFRDARAEARKVLTAEQLKKVEALKAHFGGWRAHHPGLLMRHNMPATAPAQ